MTNKPDTQQVQPNHWTRGGQAKTSDVRAATAKFLESQTPKPDAVEQSK